MNDAELNQKLAAARTPPLEPEYVADFSRSIRARLCEKAVRDIQPSRKYSFWWLGSIGVAMICLLTALCFEHWHRHPASSQEIALLQNGKILREVLTLFPNRVRAIIQDEKGVQLVLADQPDVPASAPLFVHFCTGTQCASVVTFSGQELNLAGRKVTVLGNDQGEIIVEGSRFAWSSAAPAQISERGVKIEARNLAPVVL